MRAVFATNKKGERMLGGSGMAEKKGWRGLGFTGYWVLPDDGRECGLAGGWMDGLRIFVWLVYCYLAAGRMAMCRVGQQACVGQPVCGPPCWVAIHPIGGPRWVHAGFCVCQRPPRPPQCAPIGDII